MRYRHIFKTEFYQKNVNNFEIPWQIFPQLQQISLRARDHRTRYTKYQSHSALNCYAYTFLKVDTQIVEECRRPISYLKGYSYLKRGFKVRIYSETHGKYS